MNLAAVEEGSHLWTLSVQPTHMDVFMYSAVTWNRHHIHYNKDAALNEGLKNVVVQRGLIGNYFSRMLTGWSGDPGCIKKLVWRMKSSALPDEKLIISGFVRKVLNTNSIIEVHCELEANTENNRLIAQANACITKEN